MPFVTAAQHFFSSVPATQSPTGRRGYQTIACTPKLPADAIATIEDRAQYATAPGDPIKHQFYSLAGGLYAISQIAPLAELDEFGRKGRYLAHTLVFDPANYAALEHCPLDVLEQFPFAVNLDPVFRQIGPGKGQVSAVSFEVNPLWQQKALDLAAQWPVTTTATLGRLAWHASELAGRGEPVVLVGTAAEQRNLLSLIFLLAAPSQRARLSFDTLVQDCNFDPRVTFWAQGYATPPQSDSMHLVDARPGGRVRSSLPTGGDSPYAIWMLKEALPSDLATTLPQQVWAASLDAVLMTGTPLPVDPNRETIIPQTYIKRFAHLNAAAVASRWLAALPHGLSSDLVRMLAGCVTAEPARHLQILADGLQPQDVAEFVLRSLLDLGAAPSSADRKTLEPWIRTRDYAALSTLPPLWAGDGKSWISRITALPLEDYAYVLEGLASWPSPPIPLRMALPHPKRRKLPFLSADKTDAPPDGERAIAWVHAVGRSVPPGDWESVMDALAQIDQPALDAVAHQLPSLSGQARHAIAAWLKGYRGEAVVLRAAIAP